MIDEVLLGATDDESSKSALPKYASSTWSFKIGAPVAAGVAAHHCGASGDSRAWIFFLLCLLVAMVTVWAARQRSGKGSK